MLAHDLHDSDRSDALQRLIDAFADGEAIDWDAECDANPASRRPLGNLRWLDSVRQIMSGSCDSNEETGDWFVEEMPATWGDFVIRKRIGEGAFANVYLAYDPKLDTEFALKLLKRERIASDRTRFLNEARRLAHVVHRHVVTVHGFGEHDGRPGLWMDLLKGENLEDRLEQQGRLGWREAAMIGVEMCGALAAIHRAGLVHGDVKSANVIRTEQEGHHILTDFGAGGDAASSQAWACGTPLVMAPELFHGRPRLTQAGDIYSLGTLLYRLVSGSYPVEAKTKEELARKHRERVSVPLRDRRADLPARFVQVVEQSLAKDPRQRFSSVGRMEKALLAALGPAEGNGDGRLHEVWGWLRERSRQIVVLALGLVLVAAVLGIWKLPFRVSTAIYRLEPAGPARIEPGGVLRPGDALCLEVHSSHEVYVYAFNEAVQKPLELNRLFPLPEWDLHNPLRRGTKHFLPSQELPIRVDDTGGTERILIVASRKPLNKLDDIDALLGPDATSEAATSVEKDSIDRDAAGDELADPERGLRVEPPPQRVPRSMLDRVVEILGEPTRTVQWHIIEFESDASLVTKDERSTEESPEP